MANYPMANLWQLVLIKRGVKMWNAWLNEYPAQINLSGADLLGADLLGANLRYACLTNAHLRGADLSGADLNHANLHSADLGSGRLTNADLHSADLHSADLSGANLSGANLSGANLRYARLINAHLRGADLNHAELHRADLNGADLRDAILPAVDHYGLGVYRPELYGADLSNVRWVAPNDDEDVEPNVNLDGTLIMLIGSNFLITAATLASIIQGLDVIERRWREHQAKCQQQGTHTHQHFSRSHKIAGLYQEIIEILLVMNDGSQHSFKRWVSDPDALRAYIDAFSDPASPIKPLHVVFRKREGAALRIDLTEGGKDNRQLNVILGYLKADPQ